MMTSAGLRCRTVLTHACASLRAREADLWGTCIFWAHGCGELETLGGNWQGGSSQVFWRTSICSLWSCKPFEKITMIGISCGHFRWHLKRVYDLVFKLMNNQPS